MTSFFVGAVFLLGLEVSRSFTSVVDVVITNSTFLSNEVVATGCTGNGTNALGGGTSCIFSCVS